MEYVIRQSQPVACYIPMASSAIWFSNRPLHIIIKYYGVVFTGFIPRPKHTIKWLYICLTVKQTVTLIYAMKIQENSDE